MNKNKKYSIFLALLLVSTLVKAQTQNIDEVIFGSNLPSSYALTFSTPVKKGTSSESYFSDKVEYLGILFDNAIINYNDDKKTRKNVTLSLEGKCDEILEKYFILSENIRKAKKLKPNEVTKSYTYDQIIMIPAEEISPKGIESNSTVYFAKKDNNKCRVDFHINPK